MTREAEKYYDENLEDYSLLNKLDPATAQQAIQMMEAYYKSRIKSEKLDIHNIMGSADSEQTENVCDCEEYCKIKYCLPTWEQFLKTKCKESGVIGRLSFTNKVKEIRTGTFGKQVVLELPDWADVVILCYNEYGLRPFNLCLPHQIYVDKLEKAIEGKGAVAITAIPARASEYVDIACL